MKVLAGIFVILIKCSILFGQDGSNINYVKPEELNNSYIGRKLHLDFYKNSFGSAFSDEKRKLDTVFIKVNNKKVGFIENRADDGFNNWFSKQYLESIEKIDGLKLRIKEFELLKFDKDDIFVKGFFIVVDDKGRILAEKSFTKELSFPKKDIVEYLFKAKD